MFTHINYIYIYIRSIYCMNFFRNWPKLSCLGDLLSYPSPRYEYSNAFSPEYVALSRIWQFGDIHNLLNVDIQHIFLPIKLWDSTYKWCQILSHLARGLHVAINKYLQLTMFLFIKELICTQITITNTTKTSTCLSFVNAAFESYWSFI